MNSKSGFVATGSFSIITVLFAVACVPHATAATITITDGSFEAHAISASGTMVGEIATAQGPWAWISGNAGVGPTAPFFFGNRSSANAINNAGQVVGYGPNGGFLYSGGRVSTLPSLRNATGINNSGQIVGSASVGQSLQAAILSGGTTTPLGTLGGYSSSAAGINDSAQVAGSFATIVNEPNPDWDPTDPVGSIEFNTYSDTHAFFYSGNTMSDLGTLGGYNSFAAGVNAAGLVVGYSEATQTRSGNAGSHAFVASGGQMTDIGTLGGSFSRAFGVNDSGQVVGWSSTSDGSVAPFLYSDGIMTNLNSLLPANSPYHAYEALAINNSGQIAAYGTLYGTTNYGFLIDTAPPAPEPSSAFLLVAGVSGFALLQRRIRPGTPASPCPSGGPDTQA